MALKSGDVTDVRQVETQAVSNARGLISVIRIFYNLRGNGPFVVDVPKDEFTSARAIAAVKADAEERAAVLDAFSQ